MHEMNQQTEPSDEVIAAIHRKLSPLSILVVFFLILARLFIRTVFEYNEPIDPIWIFRNSVSISFSQLPILFVITNCKFTKQQKQLNNLYSTHQENLFGVENLPYSI